MHVLADAGVTRFIDMQIPLSDDSVLHVNLCLACHQASAKLRCQRAGRHCCLSTMGPHQWLPTFRLSSLAKPLTYQAQPDMLPLISPPTSASSRP